MARKEDAASATWLAAVGQRTRLAIVRALATGPKTVTELVSILKENVSNVSHHLQVMKTAGVVNGEKDGLYVTYRLLGATRKGGALRLRHPSGTKMAVPLE